MNHSALSATPLLLSRPLLALVLLLVLASGLLLVPPAQATVSCRALAAGQVRSAVGLWSSPAANFYEVPVGGVLTSATAVLSTRIAKTGTNSEGIYMRFIGSTDNPGSYPYIAAADGYALPGAPGLALRTRITHPAGDSTMVTAGWLHMNNVSWNTAVPDYLHTVRLTVEIVRAQETLPNGTVWSIPSNMALPINFSFTTFTGADAVPGSGATYCPVVSYSTLNHLASGNVPLLSTPPRAITCTLNINNGNPEVNFGSILLSSMATVGQPPTGFDKVPVDVAYSCLNTSNAATPAYTLSWHGTGATGRTSTLQVTGDDNRAKAGIGIAMESGAATRTALVLNTGRVATPNAGRSGGSSVRLHAYPTRTNSNALPLGPFKGTATIRLNLY